MNVIKRIVISFCCVIMLSLTAKASHIIGGEINYVYNKTTKQYDFTVYIYRDCSNPANAPFDQPAYFTIFKGDNVFMTLSANLSKDTTLPLVSPNPCLTIPSNVCVQQGTYLFSAALDTTSLGYTVVYQRCCRNATIVNITNPGATGATYVATINSLSLIDKNSSPFFATYPPILICVNDVLSFKNSAIDPDGDSLVYELCQPYSGAEGGNSQPMTASSPPYTGINYAGTFSYSNPMGGNPALSIDSKSGLLTVTPNRIGQFVVGICVNEYRHGQFLGTHLRDFQFNVQPCTPQALSSFPADSNNCLGDTIHFQNFSTPNAVYHWDFGVDSLTNDTSDLQFPTYVYDKPGIYTITLGVDKAGTNCGDTTTSFVKIKPLPTAGDDTTIVYGTSGIVFAKGGPGAKYSWVPTNTLAQPDSALTLASPSVTTTYTVTITTAEDCVVNIPVIVRVTRTPIITFYNAFSPNGNGKNEYFHPITFGALTNVSFRIYNRWGQEVYESADATAAGWDGTFKGKVQPVGVYEYYFECVGAQNNQKYTYKGNVTLLR